MSLRTFLAIEIDEQSRAAMADLGAAIDAGDAKIRWVAPENLHVTLNFLGEIDDALAAEVFGLAAAVAEGHDPFDFRLCGVICVPPSGSRLRMIWAGVADPDGRIAALNDELAVAFEGLGLHAERRQFRPHVTLARIRQVRDADALRRAAAPWAETDFGLQRAERLTVFTSELTRGGPVYTPIARAPLGG